MRDWLKELKVGDLVHRRGSWGYGKLIRIDGETNLFWKAGSVIFRKDNGRIRGQAYEFVEEATPEIITEFRMTYKRRKVEQLARNCEKLTESNLDAIIKIFEGGVNE